MKQFDIKKPAEWLIDRQGDRGQPLCLGGEPAKVSVVQQVAGGALTISIEKDPSDDERFSGEQGHLGVVGEVSRGFECTNPVFAPGGSNVSNR